MKHFLGLLSILPALLAAAGGVSAQTIRSDRPLWTYEGPPSDLYPRAFVDDESFGCAQPLPTGVWRYSEDEFPEDGEYWRLDIYGVIHCALLFGRDSDAEAAGQAFEDHAWMIRLSSTQTSAGEATLWALQIGVSGGSRYLVLRQHAGDSGLDVLNLRCPYGAERRRSQIDIWVQDDCVIANQRQFRRMASAADARPRLGRLERLDQQD